MGFGRYLACLALLVFSACGFAQGGPPMVTDDPGTPGAGKWEINFGAIATHTRGRLEIAAPDADINYGWGDHIQLKLDVPVVSVRDEDRRWRTGAGTGNAGVKWRFLDAEDVGFDVSTYPQYSHSILRTSTKHGLTDPGSLLFLPLEVAFDAWGLSFAAEAGRALVRRGSSAWVTGLVAAHGCGEGRECIVELHRTQAADSRLNLLNFGLHWKLDDSLTLLAAAGREFGSPAQDRQTVLVYLGLQIAR